MKYKIKISDEDTMKFDGELLKFDRKLECDWCGKKKLVGITHYGTSHYNRLICKECAEEIKEYNKRTFGTKDSKYIKDAPDKYGLPTDEELEAELNARRESIKKQREQAVAKEQEEIRERQERESKYARDLNIIRNAKNIEDMQEIYPDQGKADTIAGELVRAYARLRYRWYNDGDTFFTGYGYTDTCSAPAAFICEHTDLYQDFFDFADPYNLEYGKDPYGRGGYGEFVDPERMGYTQFIDDLGKNLFDYIKTNAEDLIKPTTDMLNEDGESYFEEYYPRYSWVVEIPYDIREKASTRDIYDYFENLYYGNSRSEIEVTIGYDGQDLQVDNLTENEYAEALDWNIDQLWDDFRTEYEIPEDTDDEDYDEEDGD